MRTAEETAIELYQIANDVNVEYAQNTFQHGMTIAADITQQAQHQDEDAWTISDPIRGDILIARDNKVWRQE